MSDEKQYTERDLVMARRLGYVYGRHESLTHGFMTVSEREQYEREAAARYPLPKVTRPRVVTYLWDGYKYDFCLMDGCLQIARVGMGDWSPVEIERPEDDWRVVGPIYADLFTNPTEEVGA